MFELFMDILSKDRRLSKAEAKTFSFEALEQKRIEILNLVESFGDKIIEVRYKVNGKQVPNRI